MSTESEVSSDLAFDLASDDSLIPTSIGMSQSAKSILSVEAYHDLGDVPSTFHQQEFRLTELYAGLSIHQESGQDTTIGIVIHDGTYSVDYAVHHLSHNECVDSDERSRSVENHIVSSLTAYREDHLCKILGAGITDHLERAAPNICSRLWVELDIVPIAFKTSRIFRVDKHTNNVDELADSVARKCVSTFSPMKQPRLDISYRNEVKVDLDGKIHLASVEDYRKSVRAPTWNAVTKYLNDVVDRKIRIAFFSATPQGGGVALMRHALVRFLRLQGVQVEWYVPRPCPDIFRITKKNHNILQGVTPPAKRTNDEQLERVKTWITGNAERYWLDEGGPLRAPLDGGADVIIVDDPQMPHLIPLAKERAPDRPVIYRSHIEIRDDLVGQDGSAAQSVWKSLWESIRMADVFISHPVRSFVPLDVNEKALGWLPASTDWLDGLNKNMQEWDSKYYLWTLQQTCQAQGLRQLAYPLRRFIAQVARFDPSKGIPVVLKSYAKLRRHQLQNVRKDQHPQLVICGHGSIDDPDGSKMYGLTMETIRSQFQDLEEDIIVVRLGPSDQILNTILSMATVVLQLSSREGFEVKVSEALHKGKPVIATRVGGIPLQIEHGRSGYLVERGDHDSVAQHLYNLLTDTKLYSRMSKYAAQHVSDEVHTVGNALSWLYLASATTSGKAFEPGGRWINDLAREAANEPYDGDEPRLPRHLST